MMLKGAEEMTRKLIGIESTNPGSGEDKIERVIRQFLEDCGAQVTEHCVEEGRRIVKGVLPGRVEHPALVFMCHMDTVVVGEGWSCEPFGAEVRDGKIFGRGACDMKSGMAAALTAFAKTAELIREKGIQPEHSLVFIGTVDEEGDMKGAEAAVSLNWVTQEDWILDTEPTSGEVQMAHKGRTWFVVESEGVTAHASMPEKGADAIAGAAMMITEIRRQILQAPSHEELGVSTVTFGQIEGGYSPYVVSDHCRVTVDMRLVPPLTTRKAEEIVKSAIEKAQREVPGVKGRYRITGDRPAVETHRDSRLMKELREAVEAVTGEEPNVSAFPGYTDTAVTAGMTGNMNCMSYGPGNLAQAHKPDEYVEISEIERCEKVYRKLAQRFAGIE